MPNSNATNQDDSRTYMNMQNENTYNKMVMGQLVAALAVLVFLSGWIVARELGLFKGEGPVAMHETFNGNGLEPISGANETLETGQTPDTGNAQSITRQNDEPASGAAWDGQTCTEPFEVRPGDTLNKIERDCNVTVQQIMDYNCLKSDALSIGQKLYLYEKNCPEGLASGSELKLENKVLPGQTIVLMKSKPKLYSLT